MDTATIAVGDREEAVRQFYRHSTIRAARITVPPRMTNRLAMGVAGRLTVGTHSGAVHRVDGPPTACVQRVRPSVAEDTLVMAVQTAGRFQLAQHGRTASLTPGDLTVIDPAAPFTMTYPGDFAQTTVRIPREQLGLPRRIVDLAAARPFSSATDPLADLVRQYFTLLADNAELRHGPHADEVIEAGMQLLRGLLAGRAGDEERAREPLQETLVQRVLAYTQSHLAERDLNATRIAAAHNVSVRYLYVLLAREDIVLGERIRTERLAAARRELASPAGRRRTIAAVAARWGFADATHFAKVFRRQYGQTPRAWRAAQAVARTASG